MQSSIFCRHPEQTTIQGGGPFRFERCQCSAATIAAAHALDAEIFETFLAFLAPYHSDFDQISRFCADCSRLMNQERRRDGFRSFESVIFLLIFFFGSLLITRLTVEDRNCPGYADIGRPGVCFDRLRRLLWIFLVRILVASLSPAKSLTPSVLISLNFLCLITQLSYHSQAQPRACVISVLMTAVVVLWEGYVPGLPTISQFAQDTP